MPAPSTCADLVGLVLQSGLIPGPRLDTYMRQSWQAAPEGPADLARSLVRAGLLTEFQCEQLLHGRSRGFLLGKYLILERLGASRMSTVFLCHHQAMNRVVCVKVLSQERAAKSALLERFCREARAAASLDHPNIVRAHDFEETERGHLLVMEFVDGPDLQVLVDKHGPLSPLRAAHYIYQAALGLHHAHEKGLVHRDVKPANFMVDRTGTVKVLDLGLALFTENDEAMLTNGVIGSVDYLAPEQGVDSHGVDARADIYGLGATFWFLLTGAPPFGGGSVIERVLAHRTQKLPPLQSLRPDVPEGLAAIVAYMMVKNPADRYASMAEVAEVLEPFIEQPIAPPSEKELPTFCWAARKAIAAEATGSDPDLAVAPPVSPSRQIPVRSQRPSKETRPVAAVRVGGSRETKETPAIRHELDVKKAPDEASCKWKSWWIRAAAVLRRVFRYRNR